MTRYFLPGAPGCSAGGAAELFPGASLIVDSCLWYRVGFAAALFETVGTADTHVGLCSEYFRADAMVLRVEDASGNGFEVFVYYEMGSVFALWKC